MTIVCDSRPYIFMIFKLALAPEVQASSQINVLSDMFSFGMIIFALYNNGKSLFDAKDNPMLYLKQLETVCIFNC